MSSHMLPERDLTAQSIQSGLSGKSAEDAASLAAEVALEVVGQGTQVPCLDGIRRPYINLDNAATTPPMQAVADTVARFTEWYSSVHRGTGFKSQLSSEVFDESRRIVGDFVGVDWDHQTVIFCQHTTEGLNRLARQLVLDSSAVILSTVLEHHSNMLPWRVRGQVLHIDLEKDGNGTGLDLGDFERVFDEHGNRIRLLAVSGASNVTGHIPPIHDLAELAHAHGALILVDAAQLVPHRPIDLRVADAAGHIDILTFSGHKMYAPYGAGALIAPRDIFEEGAPYLQGGGAVEAVRLDQVIWSGLPEREEAGTPNLIGILALAKACQELERIGMNRVAAHERELIRYALPRLKEVPGFHFYGDADPDLSRDRVAVVSFLLDGYEHALLAAILGYEYGIAVRNGCFCAHPYVKRLARVTEGMDRAMWAKALSGDRDGLPGFVRASFGGYTTKEDIDALVRALLEIRHDGPKGEYRESKATGEFLPEGYRHPFREYFRLGE